MNEHIDTAEDIDITMPIYNLIEYGDNYSDTPGNLWQFNRHESSVTNDENPDNVNTNNSTSFKYQLSVLGKPARDGVLKNAKIAVPSKYLSNFWRSLEMTLITCNIHNEFNCT